MGYLVLIEKWAENLEEVTVSRWLKDEGEAVVSGESLCEIITEKITFEYELPEDGILRRLYCTEGSTVPVGYAIAFVGAADERPPEGVAQQNADLLAEYRRRQELVLDLDIDLQALKTTATPAARHLAREKRIQLTEVAQWLAEDRPLTEDDIRAYLEDSEQ